MAIANVTLNNTFDEWRTTTNQLIGVYDETNTLAVASFNKANSVTQDAANTTAGILASNTLVITTIANSTNILLGQIYNTVNVIYDVANTSSDLAESNSIIALSISANAESNATIALTKASNAESNIITFTANVSDQVANILASNTVIANSINTTVALVLDDFLANTDFGASFIQANTARLHANVAFIQANTARSHANVAFVQANTARSHANVAFEKANSALSNTSGSVFSGNLIITGNLTLSGASAILNLL